MNDAGDRTAKAGAGFMSWIAPRQPPETGVCDPPFLLYWRK